MKGLCASGYNAEAEKAIQRMGRAGSDVARLGLYGGITEDGSAEWVWRECHPVHADVLWELETRDFGNDLRIRGY
jgi:hypothetical protein